MSTVEIRPTIERATDRALAEDLRAARRLAVSIRRLVLDARRCVEAAATAAGGLDLAALDGRLRAVPHDDRGRRLARARRAYTSAAAARPVVDHLG